MSKPNKPSNSARQSRSDMAAAGESAAAADGRDVVAAPADAATAAGDGDVA